MTGDKNIITKRATHEKGYTRDFIRNQPPNSENRSSLESKRILGRRSYIPTEAGRFKVHESEGSSSSSDDDGWGPRVESEPLSGDDATGKTWEEKHIQRTFTSDSSSSRPLYHGLSPDHMRTLASQSIGLSYAEGSSFSQELVSSSTKRDIQQGDDKSLELLTDPQIEYMKRRDFQVLGANIRSLSPFKSLLNSIPRFLGDNAINPNLETKSLWRELERSDDTTREHLGKVAREVISKLLTGQRS